ncbi:MAG: endonuclease VII domain-containing protein [Alphaproteobacteria bacterium]|nr:endonuclease VII domain-containing protein [Alphaproteobacteria bacterium]
MRSAVAIERKYGLTQEQHIEKIKEQDNSCAICGKKDEGRVLCVDHDHKTGKVRGLLCTNCNVGLGNLKDSIQILQAAIGYLKRYGSGDLT